MATRTDVTIDWSISPRLITVLSPSVEITIQDLVDTCRDNEDEMENLSYPKLIDAAGKEPLGGGTLVGITATLQNAQVAFEARPGPTWTLCTISGGNLVAVDDAGAPIDPRYPTAFVTIDRTASSSATLQDSQALQAGSYQGVIVLDENSAFDGTEFPVGTRESPVNNAEDAILIAQSRGIGTILIASDMVLDSGDWSAGFTFRGGSAVTLTLTVGAGSDVTNCDFEHMTIEGILDGMNSIVDCTVLDVENFNGSIHESSLNGTVTLSGGTQTDVVDCYSGFAGSGPGQYATVNMGGVNNSLAVRDYHGGIEVTNGGAGTSCSFDIASGRVIVDSSVTDGNYTVRGIALVTDNSTGTATVNDQTISEVTDIIEKLLRNKSVTDPNTGIMTVYDDDGVSVLFTTNIFEDVVELQRYRGQGINVRERLE